MRLAWFGMWATAFCSTALAYLFLAQGDSVSALLAALLAFALLARCLEIAVRS